MLPAPSTVFALPQLASLSSRQWSPQCRQARKIEMQSAFRANSREVLGGESTGRGREVHRDDWVLGVANEERRQARPKDLVNVDIVLVEIVLFFCSVIIQLPRIVSKVPGKSSSPQKRETTNGGGEAGGSTLNIFKCFHQVSRRPRIFPSRFRKTPAHNRT